MPYTTLEIGATKREVMSLIHFFLCRETKHQTCPFTEQSQCQRFRSLIQQLFKGNAKMQKKIKKIQYCCIYLFVYVEKKCSVLDLKLCIKKVSIINKGC